MPCEPSKRKLGSFGCKGLPAVEDSIAMGMNGEYGTIGASGEIFYDQLAIYRERKIRSLGSSLELMQSELHSDGAKYSLIKRF